MLIRESEQILRVEPAKWKQTGIFDRWTAASAP
jgi:hypothetical protein